MQTKEQLQKQIKDAENAGAEGQKLIDKGRQMQHDASAKANELRAQLNQLEADQQKTTENK